MSINRRYVNRKDKENFKSIMEDKGYEINDIDIRQILCMIDLWSKSLFYLKNENNGKIKIVNLDNRSKEITIEFVVERVDDEYEEYEEYDNHNKNNSFYNQGYKDDYDKSQYGNRESQSYTPGERNGAPEYSAYYPQESYSRNPPHNPNRFQKVSKDEFENLNIKPKKYYYETKNELVDIINDVIKYDIDYDFWGDPTNTLEEYLEWDEDYIDSHPLIH